MLTLETLKTGIKNAMTPAPESLEDCINKWYQAYLDYAKESQVSHYIYTSVFLSSGTGNMETFKANLTTAFVPKADPTQTMTQMAQAFSSFWQADITKLFTPSVEFVPMLSIPNPDVSAFMSMSFTPTSDTDAAITMMATAIDTYTRGIKVSGSYLDTSLIIPAYLPFLATIS